ncbi:MAG: 4'-phosphopantetheinyl transferase superfamily protein [Pseudomonadota bacterium]
MLSGLVFPGTGLHSPKDWRFTAGSYGKPQLSAGQLDIDLRFNLSHTHGMVAVAIAIGLDVGIDVERIERRVADDMAIAEAYFSPSEQAQLHAITDPAQRRLAFIDLWTAKEAFIKALGRGLSMPLDSFSVDLLRACYTEKCLPAEALHLSWTLRRWQSADHLVALAIGSDPAAFPPRVSYTAQNGSVDVMQ